MINDEAKFNYLNNSQFSCLKTKEKSNKKIGCYLLLKHKKNWLLFNVIKFSFDLLKKSKFIFHVYCEKQTAPFVPVKKTG